MSTFVSNIWFVSFRFLCASKLGKRCYNLLLTCHKTYSSPFLRAATFRCETVCLHSQKIKTMRRILSGNFLSVKVVYLNRKCVRTSLVRMILYAEASGASNSLKLWIMCFAMNFNFISYRDLRLFLWCFISESVLYAVLSVNALNAPYMMLHAAFPLFI